MLRTNYNPALDFEAPTSTVGIVSAPRHADPLGEQFGLEILSARYSKK